MDIKGRLARVFTCLCTCCSRGDSSRRNVLPEQRKNIFHAIVNFCLVVPIISIPVIYSGDNSNAGTIFTWGTSLLVCAVGLYSVIWSSCLTCSVYETDAKSQDDPSVEFKLGFLWFFGVLVVLHESLYMAIDLGCLLANHPIFALTLSYRSCLILFTLTQTSFISYYKTRMIKPSKKMHQSLVLIIVSNLGLWLTTMVHDLRYQYSPDSYRSISNRSMFASELSCFWNSKTQNLISRLLPVFIPAKLEFALFSACFILKMRHFIKDSDHIIVHRERGPSSSEKRESVARRTPVRNQNSAYIMIYLCGVLLNIPFIIISVFIFNVQCFSFNQHSKFQFVWEITKIFNGLFQIFAILTGFLIGRKRCLLAQRMYKKDFVDYILILSATGSVAYKLIGLISCIVTKNNVVFFLEIIDLICFFLQIHFILNLRKCTSCKCNGNGFSYICLLLSVCNLSYWSVSSFSNLRRHNTFASQDILFGQKAWESIHDVIFPFVIFFRLISCIELFRMYRLHQK